MPEQIWYLVGKPRSKKQRMYNTCAEAVSEMKAGETVKAVSLVIKAKARDSIKRK